MRRENPRRRIEPHPAVLELIPVDGLDGAREWLQSQAAARGLTWLLAHADDGVIWGKIEGGRLITSDEAAQSDGAAARVCPPLRAQSLQQARLFAPHGEVLLWRTGDGDWRARLIRDAGAGEAAAWEEALDEPHLLWVPSRADLAGRKHAAWEEAFDEPHLLWGTPGRPLSHGFTLLEDGAQGLRHAIPALWPGGEREEPDLPRLLVRHYLGKEEFARIIASRLLDLKVE